MNATATEIRRRLEAVDEMLNPATNAHPERYGGEWERAGTAAEVGELMLTVSGVVSGLASVLSNYLRHLDTETASAPAPALDVAAEAPLPPLARAWANAQTLIDYVENQWAGNRRVSMSSLLTTARAIRDAIAETGVHP